MDNDRMRKKKIIEMEISTAHASFLRNLKNQHLCPPSQAKTMKKSAQTLVNEALGTLKDSHSRNQSPSHPRPKQE